MLYREPSKISVVSTSVIDVADKSVSAISVEKALAKDHNKNAGNNLVSILLA